MHTKSTLKRQLLNTLHPQQISRHWINYGYWKFKNFRWMLKIHCCQMTIALKSLGPEIPTALSWTYSACSWSMVVSCTGMLPCRVLLFSRLDIATNQFYFIFKSVTDASISQNLRILDIELAHTLYLASSSHNTKLPIWTTPNSGKMSSSSYYWLDKHLTILWSN